MHALRFERFGDPREVLALATVASPVAERRELVVRVGAASINPSDVKNVQGLMHGTTLSRTPGRDFAGVVVAGDDAWIGRDVYGTGGELGFTRDGSHAEYLAVPLRGVAARPASLSMQEAGAAGVTYVTAWTGLVERARLVAGETIVVTGAGGGVGSAVVQLARFVAIASAGERRVGFDLIDFYRREIRLFGVDSRSLDTVACASILERLRDGFASGALRASSIARTIPLEEGSRRTPPWLRERVRGRPSSVRVRAAFVAEVARVRISR